MSQQTIINILTTYEELFEQYSIFSNIIRGLLMGLIERILRPVCNVGNDVYVKTYELLDFTEYGPVQSLISEFRVFIYIALIISFMALGYIYILDRNNRPDWVKNAFIGLICVMTIPTLLGKLNDFTYRSSMSVLNWGNSSNTASIADSVIINNSYDLLYMVDNGFYNSGNLKSKNAIKSIKAIDMEEVVTSDDVSGTNAKKIFGNEVRYNSVGIASLEEIKKDTIFSISEPPYYYRWHLDFLPMIIQLIGIICAYLVCAWKVVQIVWELIADQLLIVLFSGELTGGQRIKKLINYFINSYIVLLLINVFIKFYQLSFDYINALSWGSLTKSLIICFISFCVAQGPNIVQQILGIDAGISNGFGHLYAATGVAKGAAMVAKAGAGMVVGAAGGVIGSAGEILKGGNDGPVTDEGRTNEKTKMEDVNNPYSGENNQNEGVIFNEGTSEHNDGINSSPWNRNGADRSFEGSSSNGAMYDSNDKDSSADAHKDMNQGKDASRRNDGMNYDSNENKESINKSDSSRKNDDSMYGSSDRENTMNNKDGVDFGNDMLNRDYGLSGSDGLDNTSGRMDGSDLDNDMLNRDYGLSGSDGLDNTSGRMDGSDLGNDMLNRDYGLSDSDGLDNTSGRMDGADLSNDILNRDYGSLDSNGERSSAEGSFNNGEFDINGSYTGNGQSNDRQNQYSPRNDNSSDSYEQNRHPSDWEKDNPLKEKSVPSMRDLKNERKVIFQEHREGMERADRSRNSIVRSAKAGYQRGKSAVKIVRHGADLINEKRNKRGK